MIDTPLAEALIAGMAIGMAVEGLKPVAEIQFSGFAYTTIDQILNHAGRMRHRTRGRLSCPMVLRTPVRRGHPRARAPFGEPGRRCSRTSRGSAWSTPPRPGAPTACCSPRSATPTRWCSSSRPGSTACSRRKSRTTARRCRSTLLHRARRQRRHARRVGRDGARDARRRPTRSRQGVAAEVLDVATLKPLDMDTILASVARTGRCVVVHEAARTCSFAAEIAAGLAEKGLLACSRRSCA